MRSLIAIHPPLIISGASGLLTYFVSSVFLLGILMSILDAKARYREYLLVKHCSPKVRCTMIQRMRSSWCGRTACIAAYPQARYIYHNWGYRWYNVMPDGVPQCFINRKFWKSAMGG